MNISPVNLRKQIKKYYIITNENIKFILVLLVIPILQFIKMKQENYDISNDIIMKIGLNPELIVQDSGPAGCYGIYQQ